MYFVDDLTAYILADDYTDFWKTLTWYRMYCVARFGANKSDYKNGFESLKNAFLELFEADKVSIYIKEPATSLLEDIENRLSRKRFTDEDIKYIADILWEFENKKEEFTEKYLNAYLRSAVEAELPKGMHSILLLLSNQENNAAIVDSFKYLDWLLQKTLNVSPHEYYGESLVNLAFAPGEGKIKLGSHENEQRGLRNLTSGLYALFRNPAAHRNIFDRNNGIIRLDGADQAAATLAAMVSMIGRLIYEKIFLSMDSQVQDELIRIASKHGWNQELVRLAWQFEYTWGIGLLPEAEYKFKKDCQLVIKLTEDEQGPYLIIFNKSAIDEYEIDEFVKNIGQISNLRTILST
jgi:hypothetical protein